MIETMNPITAVTNKTPTNLKLCISNLKDDGLGNKMERIRSPFVVLKPVRITVAYIPASANTGGYAEEDNDDNDDT
jgi:hypothetical protein